MKSLFVFAHPDDETFATGGTIAKLTKKGMMLLRKNAKAIQFEFFRLISENILE